MSTRWIVPLFLAGAVALPTAAAAHDSKFRLEADGDDGDHVRIELAAGWLSTILRHSSIDCDGADDRRTRRMARALDERGEGSVYEYTDRDGDHVIARRSRGKLILEQTDDDDGDRSTVEMPWVMAECLLLGREPAGGLGKWIADEGFDLRVDSKDGDERVRITVD